MSPNARPPISDAERVVLRVLWEQGAAGVRQVHQALTRLGQDWSRSTIITLLSRLETKGYVASDKSRFAYVFRATVSVEEVMHERVHQLAEELSAGDPAPLVLAFAERHRFTPEQLQKLRDMIDAAESKRSRSKRNK